MRNDILTVLERGDLIISDGAFGTMLQARGLPAGTVPELWNAENPQVVGDIHKAYVDAGSEIVTCNTFGGNRLRLAEAGLADRLVELNRLGVSVAREAAQSNAWVVASVGPTGQLMEPYGTLSISQAEEVYAEQVEALAEGGADAILIETQYDAEEACCAIRATASRTDLPVFCTFAFDAKGRTMMGLSPGEAARRAEDAGANVVGANCGDGPAAILAALEGMRGATGLPLMAQSNAGIPKTGRDAEAIWDVTPEEMAAHARAFVSLGARIVGGCCGTGPEHIAAMAAALRP